MSHPAVGKCVWFCTTSPQHHLTKKVISCSDGMTTTATPRTTMSANTQKVSQWIADAVVAVHGCSGLGIIDICHSGVYSVLESTKSAFYHLMIISKRGHCCHRANFIQLMHQFNIICLDYYTVISCCLTV